jgi:hypothetical protein
MPKYQKMAQCLSSLWPTVSSEVQLSSNRYLTPTWHGRIMWNVPYLIMGNIPKIKQFSWLNFICTYRAWVCARKILRFWDQAMAKKKPNRGLQLMNSLANFGYWSVRFSWLVVISHTVATLNKGQYILSIAKSRVSISISNMESNCMWKQYFMYNCSPYLK